MQFPLPMFCNKRATKQFASWFMKLAYLGMIFVTAIAGLSVGRGDLARADQAQATRGHFYALVVSTTEYEGKLKLKSEYSLERAMPEVVAALKVYGLKAGFARDSIHVCVLADSLSDEILKLLSGGKDPVCIWDKEEQTQQSKYVWPPTKTDVKKSVVPTKENIDKLAFHLATNKVKSTDTFLLYFTGHGESNEGKSDLRIFTSGANGATDLKASEDFILTLSRLKDVIGGSVAEEKIIIIDACSNPDPNGVQVEIPHFGLSRELLDDEWEKGNIILLLSSSANEYSYIDGQYQMGYFTKRLIMGLYGEAYNVRDGLLSGKGLEMYLGKVPNEVESLGEQHPQVVLPKKYLKDSNDYNFYKLKRGAKDSYTVHVHFLEHTVGDVISKLETSLTENELKVFGRRIQDKIYKNLVKTGVVSPYFPIKKYDEITKDIKENEFSSILNQETFSNCDDSEGKKKYYDKHAMSQMTEKGIDLDLLVVGMFSRPPTYEEGKKFKKLQFCWWAYDMLSSAIKPLHKASLDVHVGATDAHAKQVAKDLEKDIPFLRTVRVYTPFFDVQFPTNNHDDQVGVALRKLTECEEFSKALTANFEKTNFITYGVKAEFDGDLSEYCRNHGKFENLDLQSYDFYISGEATLDESYASAQASLLPVPRDSLEKYLLGRKVGSVVPISAKLFFNHNATIKSNSDEASSFLSLKLANMISEQQGAGLLNLIQNRQESLFSSVLKKAVLNLIGFMKEEKFELRNEKDE